jgi:hypothetical protein
MSRPSGNARRDAARRNIERGWLPLLLTMDLTGLNGTQLDWQVTAGKLARKVLRGVTVYNLSDVLRITGAANGPELLDKHFPVANPERKRKGTCRQKIESLPSKTRQAAFAVRLDRLHRTAASLERDSRERLTTSEWRVFNQLLNRARFYDHFSLCISVQKLMELTGMRDDRTVHRALRGLKGRNVLDMVKDGTDGSYVLTLLDPNTGQPFPDDLDGYGKIASDREPS